MKELCQQVLRAAGGRVKRVEILLVDDGSRDNTATVGAELAANEPSVRFLSFSRNFGKEAAMLAGLQHAQGDAVIIMDGDLQHPPALIASMIDHWYEGADQVIAQRDRKGDPWLRSVLSQQFYALTGRLMNLKLKDGVGDFRLMSRQVVDAVLKLTEGNRFSKGLFAWVGFEKTTTLLQYSNVERQHGTSSWSFTALVNYAVDGILAFNDRPLRIAIHTGLVAFLVFVAYLVWLFIMWLVGDASVPGYLTTIAAIVGIGGMQMIMLGLVGEYVGRTYTEVKKRPHYILSVDSAHPELKWRPQLSIRGHHPDPTSPTTTPEASPQEH